MLTSYIQLFRDVMHKARSNNTKPHVLIPMPTVPNISSCIEEAPVCLI